MLPWIYTTQTCDPLSEESQRNQPQPAIIYSHTEALIVYVSSHCAVEVCILSNDYF